MQAQVSTENRYISTFYFENQNRYARIIIGFLNFYFLQAIICLNSLIIDAEK